MNIIKRNQLIFLMAGAIFIATSPLSADVFGVGRDCRLRIGGRVTRSSDRGPLPQPRTPVHMLNKNGERLFTVRTDRDGYYVFLASRSQE